MVKYWKNWSPPNKITGSCVLEQSIRKEKGTKTPTYQAQWDPRQISPRPELSCYSCREGADGCTPFPHCAEKAWRTHDAVPQGLTHKTEVIPLGVGMGFEHKERATSERGCLKVNWDVSGHSVMLRSCSQPEQGTGRAGGQGCIGQWNRNWIPRTLPLLELGAAQLTCGVTPLPLWKHAAKFRALWCATDGKEAGNFLSPGFWWNTRCVCVTCKQENVPIWKQQTDSSAQSCCSLTKPALQGIKNYFWHIPGAPMVVFGVLFKLKPSSCTEPPLSTGASPQTVWRVSCWCLF